MSSGAMWGLMALGLALLWGGVAFAARVVLGGRATSPTVDSFRLLDERLARGEISTEEYRLVRQELTTGH